MVVGARPIEMLRRCLHVRVLDGCGDVDLGDAIVDEGAEVGRLKAGSPVKNNSLVGEVREFAGALREKGRLGREQAVARAQLRGEQVSTGALRDGCELVDGIRVVGFVAADSVFDPEDVLDLGFDVDARCVSLLDDFRRLTLCVSKITVRSIEENR
ncbi:MAG: hypothetical protein BWY06_03112 [Candidatus Latescibacteria bacterium ADurb.Bin168]|nr:MAG: hypothetical protein BWY06_03112 [Candidatus Latescibacteria bacterium ADurb.Bin168]